MEYQEYARRMTALRVELVNNSFNTAIKVASYLPENEREAEITKLTARRDELLSQFNN